MRMWRIRKPAVNATVAGDDNRQDDSDAANVGV